jgi:hypothetical protein
MHGTTSTSPARAMNPAERDHLAWWLRVIRESTDSAPYLVSFRGETFSATPEQAVRVMSWGGRIEQVTNRARPLATRGGLLAGASPRQEKLMTTETKKPIHLFNKALREARDNGVSLTEVMQCTAWHYLGAEPEVYCRWCGGKAFFLDTDADDFYICRPCMDEGRGAVRCQCVGACAGEWANDLEGFLQLHPTASKGCECGACTTCPDNRRLEEAISKARYA